MVYSAKLEFQNLRGNNTKTVICVQKVREKLLEEGMRNYLNDTVVNETSGNCTVPVILNAFNMTRNFFQCPQDKRWDNRSFSCIQGKDLSSDIFLLLQCDHS